MIRWNVILTLAILLGMTACFTPQAGEAPPGQEAAPIEDPEKEKIARILKEMEETVTQVQQDMEQRARAEQALAEMEKEIDQVIRAQLQEKNKEIEAALARMQKLIQEVAQARGQPKPQTPATPQEDPLAQEQREVRESLERIESQIALYRTRQAQKKLDAVQALSEMEEAVHMLSRAERERREKKRLEALASLKKMELDLARLPKPDPALWVGWDKNLFEDRYHNVLLRIRESLERYREAPQ